MALGATRSKVPASPTNIPSRVGPCKRSPPGMAASSPIIQKGEVVINSAASPLGTHNSANARHPFPMPIMITPSSAINKRSLPEGNWAFARNATTSSTVPETMYRMDIRTGGDTTSSAMRMPR